MFSREALKRTLPAQQQTAGDELVNKKQQCGAAEEPDSGAVMEGVSRRRKSRHACVCQILQALAGINGMNWRKSKAMV